LNSETEKLFLSILAAEKNARNDQLLKYAFIREENQSQVSHGIGFVNIHNDL
jgi:hypothetical protein